MAQKTVKQTMANRNDIDNELRELGSILADNSRDMPYQTPTGYFDNFADKVTTSIPNYTQELPDTTMPYDVPDMYFASLPHQLLENVKQTPATKKTKSITIWQSMRWAAAALLILAVGIGSYRILTPQPINVEEQLSTISEDAISGYIQNNLDDFDPELLANSSPYIATDFTEVNEDAIESYLEVSEWQ